MPQIHKMQRMLYMTTRIVKHLLMTHSNSSQTVLNVNKKITGKTYVLFVVELAEFVYQFVY